MYRCLDFEHTTSTEVHTLGNRLLVVLLDFLSVEEFTIQPTICASSTCFKHVHVSTLCAFLSIHSPRVWNNTPPTVVALYSTLLCDEVLCAIQHHCTTRTNRLLCWSAITVYPVSVHLATKYRWLPFVTGHNYLAVSENAMLVVCTRSRSHDRFFFFKDRDDNSNYKVLVCGWVVC